MIIYEIANLLTGLFEAIMAFMLFNNYMIQRDNMPKFVYPIAVIFLSSGIDAINTIFNYGILNVVFIFVLIIAFSFVYRPDIKSGVIMSVLTVVICSCTEVLILYIITILKNCDKEYVYLDPSLRMLGIALSKTLAFAIIKIICLFSKRNKLKMPILHWMLYSSVFAVDVLAIYLIFDPASNMYSEYMQVIGSIGLLYSILITLYLYENMSTQAEKLKEKELLEQQYKAQVSHLHELVLAQEQISVYHDLANHMISVKSYLDHHNYEDGNQYLSKLMDKIDVHSNIIDTGNIAIDAIITSKRNLAQKNNIIFKVDLQIPEKLNIDPSDCCVILGNALDNAIEACRHLEEGRYITIKMAYHDNILSCKITNAIPKSYEKNKLLLTTKRDPQNHGIGTKNIKETLKKYKHAYRMEYENNQFIFSFIIYEIFIN